MHTINKTGRTGRPSININSGCLSAGKSQLVRAGLKIRFQVRALVGAIIFKQKGEKTMARRAFHANRKNHRNQLKANKARAKYNLKKRNKLVEDARKKKVLSELLNKEDKS